MSKKNTLFQLVKLAQEVTKANVDINVLTLTDQYAFIAHGFEKIMANIIDDEETLRKNVFIKDWIAQSNAQAELQKLNLPERMRAYIFGNDKFKGLLDRYATLDNEHDNIRKLYMTCVLETSKEKKEIRDLKLKLSEEVAAHLLLVDEMEKMKLVPPKKQTTQNTSITELQQQMQYLLTKTSAIEKDLSMEKTKTRVMEKDLSIEKTKTRVMENRAALMEKDLSMEKTEKIGLKKRLNTLEADKSVLIVQELLTTFQREIIKQVLGTTYVPEEIPNLTKLVLFVDNPEKFEAPKTTKAKFDAKLDREAMKDNMRKFDQFLLLLGINKKDFLNTFKFFASEVRGKIAHPPVQFMLRKPNMAQEIGEHFQAVMKLTLPYRTPTNYTTVLNAISSAYKKAITEKIAYFTLPEAASEDFSELFQTAFRAHLTETFSSFV